MNVTIERTGITRTTESVDLPLYACIEEEYEATYVKITHNHFASIKATQLGYEFTGFPSNNLVINAIWLDNKCDKSIWDEQVEIAKQQLTEL